MVHPVGGAPDQIEQQPTRHLRLRPLRRALMVSLLVVGSACGAGDGRDDASSVPAEPQASAMARTLHVSGVACSQPREGVGVDLGDGWILTSGHVMDGITDVTVLRADGSETNAKVEHVDRVLDIAMLSVGDFLPGVVEFADVRPGESGMVHIRRQRLNPNLRQGRAARFVSVAGDERSVPFTVDRRILANTEDVGRGTIIVRPSTQITATLTRGDSGASMWDDEGRIVGVVWAVSNQHERRAFAVQGDELETVLALARTSRASGPTPC